MLAVVLAALSALLTAAIIANPRSSQDLAVMNWITDWDLPGLTAFFTVVGSLTSVEAGMVYGAGGLAGLLILRMQRLALAFVMVGLMVGVASFLGDYALSDMVERSRPLTGSTVSSYPSGHVFGGTLLFGFLAFLAIEHRLHPRFSITVVLLMGILIISVGPSRIYDVDHWPSDVAAGYLFAGLALMILFPVYRRYTDRGLTLGLLHPKQFSAVMRAVFKRSGPRKTAR